MMHLTGVFSLILILASDPAAQEVTQEPNSTLEQEAPAGASEAPLERTYPLRNDMDATHAASLEPGAPALKLNSVEIDALSLLVSYVSLRYERALTPRWSLALNPLWGSIYNPSDVLAGGSIQARRYLSQHPMQGLYVSPQIQGIFLWSRPTRGYVISLRALVGYRWVIQNCLSLFIGGGIQFVWYDFAQKLVGEEIEFSGFYHYTGFLPATEMGIGYMF